MRTLFLILSLYISGISAQNSKDLFNKANELYKNAKYQEAIDTYSKIIKKGEESSGLYYNLGNCYYKLNKVAPTIYNYEKALLLNPSNEDAKNNLAFAKRLTLDRIEPLPKTLIQKIEEKLFQQLHFDSWAILAVISSFLIALFFVLYYFANTPTKKRFHFIGILSWIFLLIVFLSIAVYQYNTEQSYNIAIVYSEKVEVQNEPIASAPVSFTLHEGTKLTVLDTVDNWKKIKIADGKIGWVLSEVLKEL